MGKPQIAIIVAMDEQRGIGLQGDMPWKLSADLKKFKKITMGHPIIMGRKTFESLPYGALPGRHNIVVSGNPDFLPKNTTVVASPQEALQVCSEESMAFIVGGAQLYSYFLPLADFLYITLIHHTYSVDTRFPPFSLKDYMLIDRERIQDPEVFMHPFEFLIYKRN
jgi:dihydrofolate reductase